MPGTKSCVRLEYGKARRMAQLRKVDRSVITRALHVARLSGKPGSASISGRLNRKSLDWSTLGPVGEIGCKGAQDLTQHNIREFYNG